MDKTKSICLRTNTEICTLNILNSKNCIACKIPPKIEYLKKENNSKQWLFIKLKNILDKWRQLIINEQT